ncbi:MAG: hypothetical protein DRJ96_00450 [Thermoprotei archaeon]|nr:MAG: hypothetical protein DRJ96_00450 [Thermoprotei archaeon]
MEHRKLFPYRLKVVVRDWVRLKCKYGCSSYGKRLTCPPYSPTPEEMRRVLKEYEIGLLVKFGPSVIEGGAREGVNVHEVMFKLERAAFLRGYYPAFGLACGPCTLCPECNVERGICRKPHMARPSMEAYGIDVYATVKDVGLELRVVTSYDQRPTYFGLLLLT